MKRFVVASLLGSLLASLAPAAHAGTADDGAVSGSHFAQPPAASASASTSTRAASAVAPTPVDAAAPAAGILAPPRTLDRAIVRAALVRARAANLAAFRAYQQKGVFPSNTFKPGALNVWRDADGHFCAAATIIKASGRGELVDRVAEQNNFIHLADVKQGPLMDWILTSGFTQQEIDAIQAPFVPVVEQPQVVQEKPLVVDSRLRKLEDARLRAKYTTVTKAIVKYEVKSLDVATDRLLLHPALARQLVDAFFAPFEG